MTIKVPNETKEVWAILQGIANKYGRYVKSLSRNIQGTWDVEAQVSIMVKLPDSERERERLFRQTLKEIAKKFPGSEYLLNRLLLLQDLRIIRYWQQVDQAIYWKEQEKMEQEMREAIQAINDVFVSS